MCGVTAPRVSAAPFSFIRENVSPAASQAFFDNGKVIIAQRFQSPEHHLFCFTPGYLFKRIFHEGSIQVIHMQLFDPQHPFSHFKIPVEWCQARFKGLHKPAVHGDRDVVAVKRSIKG